MKRRWQWWGLAAGLGVLGLVAALHGTRPSQSEGTCRPGAVDPERLKSHVRALSETFHPRDSTHPENLEHAAAYVEDALAKAGGQVESQPYRVGGRTYRNLVARFGPETGERIVVGAHYDAVRGTPGADDNASGVAGLLELASWLGQHPPPLRVDLVAFTLEEPPYFRTRQMGSKVYAQSLRDAGVRVRGMFSLEMLGAFTDAPGTQQYPSPVLRLRYPGTGNFIAVIGRMGENGLAASTADTMRAATPLPVESLNAPRSMEGIDFSDHGSFWDVGYPAIMVTDTAFFRNPRYHEANDTWDTLDYARMAQVVQGVQCAVQALATADQPTHGATGPRRDTPPGG